MRKLFVSALALLAISVPSVNADAPLAVAEANTVVNNIDAVKSPAPSAQPEAQPVEQPATPAVKQETQSGGVVISGDDLLVSPMLFQDLFYDSKAQWTKNLPNGFITRIGATKEICDAIVAKDAEKLFSLIVKTDSGNDATRGILKKCLSDAVAKLSQATIDECKKISDYQTAIYGDKPEAAKSQVSLVPTESMDEWLKLTGLDKELGDLTKDFVKKSSDPEVIKERRDILIGLAFLQKNGSEIEVPRDTVKQMVELSDIKKRIEALLNRKMEDVGSAKPALDKIEAINTEIAELQSKIDTEKTKVSKEVEAAEAQKKAAEAKLKEAQDKVEAANAMPARNAAQRRNQTAAVSAANAELEKVKPEIEAAEKKLAELKKPFAELEAQVNSKNEELEKLRSSDEVKGAEALGKAHDRKILPELQKALNVFKGDKN